MIIYVAPNRIVLQDGAIKILESMFEKEVGNWRKLHKEELSQDIIWVIK
jgi:hypothetical protein